MPHGRTKLKAPIVYMPMQIGRLRTGQMFPPVIVSACRSEVSIIGPRTIARISGAAENATLRSARPRMPKIDSATRSSRLELTL